MMVLYGLVCALIGCMAGIAIARICADGKADAAKDNDKDKLEREVAELLKEREKK